MAGAYIKPKAHNRHIFINIGGQSGAKWVEIAAGISTRGTSISESKEDYYYMPGKGKAESEMTEQTIERTFSGNRFIGDEAQDYILRNMLHDLGSRELEYIMYYDNVAQNNGEKGTATVAITDDGSGDAPNRETVEFALNINAGALLGTVTLGEDGVPVFTEAA